MNGSSFKYLIKQGIVNTWLNRLMSLASVAILTACLILIGGASLITMNVRDFFVAVEQQNELVVFIKEGVTDAEISALGKNIEALDNVISMTYISKADALEEQKKYMGEDGVLLEGLENDNPMPASYRVTLGNLSLLSETQSKIEKFSSIDSIVAPTYLAETLAGIERILLIFGAIIISILVIAAMVVISNTIRLTVFARRREINIMKYVGATNSFIRLPFVVEGITIGIISSVISFFTIYGIYRGLGVLLDDSIVPWVQSMTANLISFNDVWHWFAIGFLAIGVVIGSIGSASAIKKHLKV